MIRSLLSLPFSRLNSLGTWEALLEPLLIGKVLQSLNLPFTGLLPLSPYLSCTEESTAGHSTGAVAFPVLSRGQGSPSLVCWQYSA